MRLRSIRGQSSRRAGVSLSRMAAFRVFKQFAGRSSSASSQLRFRVGPKHSEIFPEDSLAAAFARALCEERATSLKEILEAFEFFQAVRRRVAAPRMVDVYAGHGLVGVLFALFERKVEAVTLLDRKSPPSYDRIVAAADRIGPWTRPKLRFEERRLAGAEELMAGAGLQAGDAVVAVHACGFGTDQAIQLAIDLGGSFAALPCCRPHRHHPAPDVLKRELGGDLAVDVDRTYALERAGYRVRWSAIPEVVTPMNRVLVAVRQATGTDMVSSDEIGKL